jgi:predicted GNAT superfamily acetyltransferase
MSSANGRTELSLVEIHDMPGHIGVANLFAEVWGAELITAAALRAMAHSGNYVVGAYRDGELVGATMAFFGRDEPLPGDPPGSHRDHLHSHIAGVLPGEVGAGVGYAMKQHQRDWALARGIPTICWTFDPLVRRNAYFNLHKLGAGVTEYLPDFYGDMPDALNSGDASDRLFVVWELDSPLAVAAAQGRLPEIDPDAAREAGAVLVGVPPDIEELRRQDPEAAARLRQRLRAELMAPMEAGRRITGFAREGWYVLEEKP